MRRRSNAPFERAHFEQARPRHVVRRERRLVRLIGIADRVVSVLAFAYIGAVVAFYILSAVMP